MPRSLSALAVLALLVSLPPSFVACVGDDPPPASGADPDASTATPTPGPQDASFVDAPTDAAPPPAVLEVATGSDASCALYSDGSVYCWGDNDFGELGPGATLSASHLPPTRVGGLPEVVQIAMGKHTACAVAKTGEVLCWGENTYGELGVAPATTNVCGAQGGDQEQRCRPEPGAVPGLSAAKVFAGYHFGCAALGDGTVYCWGHNTFASAARTPSSGAEPPAVVPGLSKITSMKLGYDGRTACALDQDGAVWCWGDNSQGQLGHAPGDDGDVDPPGKCGDHSCTCSAPSYDCANPAPQRVPLPAGAKAVDVVSGRTVFAVLDDGTVYGWGRDNGGELLAAGGPSATSHETPTELAGPTGAVSVGGGAAYCALDDKGAVRCWGPSDLATGSATTDDGCVNTGDEPRLCHALGAVNGPSLKAVSVSNAHAIGVTMDGTIVGWGDDRDGRVGAAPSAANDGGTFVSTMAPVVGLPH